MTTGAWVAKAFCFYSAVSPVTLFVGVAGFSGHPASEFGILPEAAVGDAVDYLPKWPGTLVDAAVGEAVCFPSVPGVFTGAAVVVEGFAPSVPGTFWVGCAVFVGALLVTGAAATLVGYLLVGALAALLGAVTGTLSSFVYLPKLVTVPSFLTE